MSRTLFFDGNILVEDFLDHVFGFTVIFGSWEEHVISFWNHRDDANVLFITYEELHKVSAGLSIYTFTKVA